MKNLFVYILFVLAIVLLFGFVYSINPKGGMGKKLSIEKKCISYHSAEIAEIERYKNDYFDLSIKAEFPAKNIVKNEKIK